MRPILLAPALVSILFALLAADGAQGASFACGRARTPDERAICADRALNDQDVRVAVMYDFLRGLHAMGGRGAILDDQRAWLAERRRCGAGRACLAAIYARRVRELQADYDRLPKPL